MEPQYTVLARRFRPQTFTEVVGQERVAQTLRNAIHDGRVAHAYLFTGARGVGKTSMARIFAKALNCPDAVDGVPCNVCEQCRGISVGQDVDVSEIDGASNRGIDDIRSLRANVNIKSMRSKFKIYIIDEVHMLTKEAFNALLKTLEEPPPMVKFIFCTTESNKVPDTILSRCQRFDFGTISTDNITIRLRQLAEAEGFQVDEAALELVARRAAGSMRDSQSLFDQLLAFGSKQISSADVHRLLGTAPDDRLTGMVDALIERRQGDALMRLDAAMREGVQLEAFTDQLVAYFRDLMVTACEATSIPLLAVGSDCRDLLRQQAQRWGLQTITTAMQILAEAKSRMQRVSYGRVLAELALVRISCLEDLDRLDDLISQLKAGVVVSAPALVAQRAPAHSNSSAPTELPSPSAPSAGQKKSEPLAVLTRPSAPLEAISPPPTLSIQPTIEWKEGCGNDLQLAIADRLNDMTGASVRRSTALAIIGPNVLEFSLPMNYDVERKTLDRPETIARLESVIQELVGIPIRIRFRTVEAVESAAKVKAAATSAPMQRSQIIEDPEDPYLQDVTRTFGVKNWKVRELLAEPSDNPRAETSVE
ncbi:DNA polymerase III subunit gamma/tau [Schlesneria paludicola]|uniref:DNA polymerase III subunit gamma/tau n=1 Tax=Schlesneria paludicola TaxID=360056 RepID=UPI00029A9F89|nr:DNA polymerase III subunit gamma/tau [Schlesneria paludicola]